CLDFDAGTLTDASAHGDVLGNAQAQAVAPARDLHLHQRSPVGLDILGISSAACESAGAETGPHVGGQDDRKRAAFGQRARLRSPSLVVGLPAGINRRTLIMRSGDTGTMRRQTATNIG